MVDPLFAISGQFPRQLQRQQQVFAHRQGADQVEKLEDEADMVTPEQGALVFAEPVELNIVKNDIPGVGPIDSADQVEQGRFARTAAPEQRHAFAREERGAETAEHRTQAVALPVALGQ